MRVRANMAMTAKTVVQKFLIGDYPASRDELVERARSQGADMHVLGLVRALQTERFASAQEVERALAEVH
jgi:hypothetical protein